MLNYYLNIKILKNKICYSQLNIDYLIYFFYLVFYYVFMKYLVWQVLMDKIYKYLFKYFGIDMVMLLNVKFIVRGVIRNRRILQNDLYVI